MQRTILRTDDHRRDSAGLRYVYPVISRRASGVSVGINLNPNNACNWACLYCQVEGLTRGGPPPIDLDLLERELAGFLESALHGDFMQQQVPPEARHLMDVAFSGNGEPTSSAEFSDAVERVARVLNHFSLDLPPRLITNGSLLHRRDVQTGLRRLGELGGEVWFKLDRATAAEILEINGVPGMPDRISRALETSAGLVRTWVQTCWFALDGAVPSSESVMAYCDILRPLAPKLAGVHLYGLARPSMQPAARRLSALSADEMQGFAQRIEIETGLKVIVSP
jgi:wyosine [tRNA(Phe)-imidazoG37] synthetase (radical SAM superfamily)